MRAAKIGLRREMLARRDALPPEARAEASLAIAARVAELPEFARARAVASYVPIGSEVDARPLLLAALASGKRVAVPRTDVAAHALVLHEIRDLAGLRPGAFRVPEPDPRVHRDLAPGEIDAIVVPAIAFDRAGHRLGYGRGYFDRYLARFPGAKIGLAFETLLVDAIPAEPHDVAVGVIVTETRALRIPEP